MHIWLCVHACVCVFFVGVYVWLAYTSPPGMAVNMFFCMPVTVCLMCMSVYLASSGASFSFNKTWTSGLGSALFYAVFFWSGCKSENSASLYLNPSEPLFSLSWLQKTLLVSSFSGDHLTLHSLSAVSGDHIWPHQHGRTTLPGPAETLSTSCCLLPSVLILVQVPWPGSSLCSSRTQRIWCWLIGSCQHF